jgi:hypothetical protein
MTQGASGGRGAPATTDYGPSGQIATGDAGSGGAAPSGSPSPTSPTTSTPWGSMTPSNGQSGSGPHGPAQGAQGTQSSQPTWSSAPLGNAYADAPTSSVPLVQGTRGSGPTSGPAPAGAGANRGGSSHGRPRGPRRARLQLRHINPWTVLKFSCVLSIALFFVWLIVVGVLFGVLDGAGVINKINDTYTTIQGGSSKAPVTAGVVFGTAAIIGVVNIVLFIALSTVGSVVYNLCADLVGGIEITLSER